MATLKRIDVLWILTTSNMQGSEPVLWTQTLPNDVFSILHLINVFGPLALLILNANRIRPLDNLGKWIAEQGRSEMWARRWWNISDFIEVLEAAGIWMPYMQWNIHVHICSALMSQISPKNTVWVSLEKHCYYKILLA